MFDDTKILQSMRRMAWQRAIAELKCVSEGHYPGRASREDAAEMSRFAKKVNAFIQDIEDEGLV